MEIIFFSAFLVTLIVIANILVVRSKPRESFVFHIFLFLVNVPVFLIGLGLITVLSFDLSDPFSEFGFDIENLRQISVAIVLIALWGMVVTLGPVRRLLARILPLDPSSPVHTLALVFSGYLAGQSVLTLSLDGLTGLVESAAPVSVVFFVVSEFLLAILAFLGVGFLIRRKGTDFLDRLGLTKPSLIHLIASGFIIIGLVIFQALAGGLWALLNPDQAELLESVNTLLLANVDTVWEWFFLAMAAGIGEELLFRGALQPALGLGFTSLLFALVHVQYGFTPFMLVIVILALILGLVRKYFSTTIAIIVHVGYDFVLGLLALLATYLQQYVS